MRSAQEQELLTVENAQKAQFIEFSQAWDNYMSDYEATAYLSLEKLKEKHLMEIEQLRERIRKDYKIKLKLSKELLEMRKRVRLYVGMKQYDDAELVEQKANALEAIEREKMEEELEDIILKQEDKLRRKQQLALSALLKRIQRDRNEQLKHRQMDSQRLIQRNKNLLLDLLKKQNMEIRRTTQFLNFALGTRSPANPQYPKSTLYTDNKDAKLSFPKNKIPYYDPVSKTIKVPGKDQSDTKSKPRRKSTAAGSKKGKKQSTKAIKDKESEYDEDSIIKPQPVKN
jgi:DNA-binding XRE family transcriptional regulator